jgi:malate:Na+ symporter
MMGGFAVIMGTWDFTRGPWHENSYLKDIGGPAVLAFLVPSVLVFFNFFNPALLEAVTILMETFNYLYLYISCLVAGSMYASSRL